DPGQLALFSLMLRRLPCEVRTVDSAPKALEMLRDTPPALVLLDIRMPEMDGLALLRLMRATEGLHGIKVILFTAWAATVGPTDLRLADKLLAKPASRERLEQE